MLLAFDTATEAVTVAVYDDTVGGVVAESTLVDARRHGELLAPGIKRVLAEAGVAPTDLSGIAVGVGPGPFTGLRVGIVTARTMAATLGVSLVGVCTLDVVAAAHDGRGQPFLVATDARRKEVYWASYDTTGRRKDGPHVDRPDHVSTSLPVVGRGGTLYPDWFPHAVGPEHPNAGDLARLVAHGLVEPLSTDPLYLRRPDAAEPPALSSSQPVVRRAARADLDALVDLEQRCLGSEAWSRLSIEGELAGQVEGRGTVLAAAKGDQIAGYAVGSWAGDVADVRRVAVDAGWRRRGIGADLVRAVMVTARAAGCGRMLLEVAADNRAAIGLYFRLGFVEIDRRNRYYPSGADALVLEAVVPDSGQVR